VKYVDCILSEISWDQKESNIRREDTSIFAMSDDWKGALTA